MNQLEVSCMRPLLSIANQEKFNQLIYLVHPILLMQKTIEESNTKEELLSFFAYVQNQAHCDYSDCY